MLIHAQTNTLIFQHPEPSVVTSTIPRSRVVEHKGRPLVQVHFGLDEMLVLRNLGIKAPSPIRTQYAWRRNQHLIPAPFNHQIDTAEFFTLHRQCICLNGMGTGKTLAAAWAADYLMDVGKVNRAIIVTPRSTLWSAWGDTLQTHFLCNRKVTVLTGSRQRRLDLLAVPSDFYVINHDGLKVIESELRKRQDINLWILDEAAEGWRNATTARYKLTRDLIRNTDWLWLMTGTPTPTAPTDAWALARLIRNPDVPKYFNAFKERTMLQVSPYKWVPRVGSSDEAYRILQPGIRFRKEDCLDLPPVLYQRVTCELTTEQKTAYAAMQKHLIAETDCGSTIVAANAAVKLVKLLQIAAGVVYSETGVTELDASERLEALETLCAGTESKCIVYVPFKHAQEMVARHLSKRWSVAVVNGDTSDSKRREIFKDFQTAPEPRVLVAHPRTTSHGLTLTAADLTVWYAPIFMAETFEQANNRMNRPGQTKNMTVATIAATAMELEVYRTLEERGNMQQCLLALYNELDKSV